MAGSTCWPNAVTWTPCAPAPTPATDTLPGGWPGCWPNTVTWTGCAPGPSAGDRYAASWLADLLAEDGDLDGLRTRADTGDQYAALRLADLLAERGDLDGLGTRVGAGDRYAASRLADQLIKQSRDEEAERLRRFGLNPERIDCLLVKIGRAHVAGRMVDCRGATDRFPSGWAVFHLTFTRKGQPVRRAGAA